MGFFDTPSYSSGRPLPSLVTPINFGNLSAGSTTGSTSSTTQTTQTAQTATTPTGGTSSWGSLDSILGVATQATQIGGAINYQRQQSGASARRQSRVAQCGKRPLLGKRRKREYQKCIANYETSLLAPYGGGVVGDVNKNIEGGGSSMKFVWIGLGVVAIGAIAFLALRKK